MKKKSEKVVPVEGEERMLGENDTEEIKDFIKQLGLEGLQPNSFEIPSVVREKKIKPRKAAKPKASTDTDKTSYQNSNTNVAKWKNTEGNNSKFQNKNKTALKPPITTIKPADQPTQSKKIIFDESYIGNNSTKKNNAKVQPPIDLFQAPQNKKVIFDEDYILKSSNSSGLENNPMETDNQEWYNLLIKPDVVWYQQGRKDLPDPKEQPSAEEVRKCEEEGKKYLEEDTVNFQRVRAIGSDKSETKWIQTVLKSGAFADKIAAHTLLLQESPVHNLSSFKFLISLVDVKGRRECLASLDALLRLFTEGKVLNPNAKLSLMSKKPIGSLSTVTPRERKELLALWYFEVQLKDYYNQFIVAMDGLMKDPVETTRRTGIATIATLLAYCPEQEQNLLSRLVNKIGDPTRAVATSTVGQLEKLLQKHSQMKSVVVSEVERLLYRPNINTKAQYYALCFLSQILLDSEDVLLATKLIIIYVSFFKACVKKGEVDSKLMSSLLTGLKRAYPYSKTSTIAGGPLDGHVDTLFKLVHMVRFSLAIQVLCILDQIVDVDKSNSDRFYSVLFRKLFDADIAQSTKQTMFLNLLYRALKRDDSLSRQRMFIKRILQVCLSSPPQFACGLLYLVSELIKVRPVLKTFQREEQKYVEEDEDEEEHYKDVDDEEEEEEDSSNNLVTENTVKENVSKVDTATKDESKEDAKSNTNEPVSKPQNNEQVKSTWIHRVNSNSKKNSRIGYDPLARNPLFGRAEESGGLWELQLLSNHFHPSVSLFAKTIMGDSRIEYSGDPLQDFTLSRFLDRFVFRNPKQVTATSQKNAPAQRRVLGRRSTYAPRGVRAMAVDSKEFVKQPKNCIPADEMFLYQYFKQRISRGPKLDKDSDDDDSDMESVASEEFEQYLAEETEMDFASEIKPKSKGEKSKKKGADGEDEEDDEEEGDGDEELEAAEVDSCEDFDNDEEFQDAFKDFDDMLNDSLEDEASEGGGDDTGTDSDDEGGFREDDVEFSDDVSDEDLDPAPAKVSSKSKSKKRPIDDGDDLDWALEDQPSGSSKKRSRNLFKDDGMDFVAAEDFAAMLESNAGGLNTGTTEALANKDKASVKQLQWEMSRDRWMKDLNKPKGKGPKGFKGGKRAGGAGGGGGGGKSRKNKSGPAFRKNKTKTSKRR